MPSIPKEIAEKVISKCLFLRPFAKGHFVPKEHIRNKNLIVISDSFFKDANSEEIERVILHEVAYFVLGHCQP